MELIKKALISILAISLICGCSKKEEKEVKKDDFVSQMTMKGYDVKEIESRQAPMIDDGIIEESDKIYEYFVLEPIEHIDKIYSLEKSSENGDATIFYYTFDEDGYASLVFLKTAQKFASLINYNHHATNLSETFEDGRYYTIVAYAHNDEVAKAYYSFASGVGLDLKNKAVIFYMLEPERMNHEVAAKITPEQQVKAVVEGIKDFGIKEVSKSKKE